MDLSAMSLFFSGALGAFNGIIIAVHSLFFKKLKSNANRFFGLFLLTLSIRMGKSVYYYYTEDLPNYFLFIALIAFFLIGPFLLFFLQSTLDKKHGSIFSFKVHTILLFLTASLLGIVYTFTKEPFLWRNLIIDFIYFEWFIYSLLSFHLILPLIRKAVLSKNSFKPYERHALTVFFMNSLVLVGSIIGHFTIYIIGSVTFSLIIYLYLALLFLNKKRSHTKSYLGINRNTLNPKDIKGLLRRLEELMKTEQLFINPNLKSLDVAQKLDIPLNQFSELINVNLSKNFSTFLNEYRVQYAIDLMRSNPNYTIEAIGYESGFNSKSTFYKAFKKQIGTSPAKYQSKICTQI